MGKTARDLMTTDVETLDENATLLDAAQKLRDLDVGLLPVCGADGRLKGVVTDRDIVVKALAEGKDPASTTAAELGQGDSQTVTIGADDSIDEALRVMETHQVRRLPVIDGTELVGIIAQADLARALPEDRVGRTVEEISR